MTGRRISTFRVVPLEHDEQARVMTWARAMQRRWPELALLHACPNGGSRGKGEAGRLRAEGVVAGVPDLSLPIPRGDCAALFLEMKRRGAPPSAVSADQQRWIELLNRYGNRAVVCRGADEAIAVLTDYLTGATEAA